MLRSARRPLLPSFMATADPQLVANGVVTNGGPAEDEVELLRGSVQAGVVAQYVIAFAAAIGLIYLLKPVLVSVLVATLLAFALDPIVVALARVHVPRAVGAAIALLLLLGLSVALVF